MSDETKAKMSLSAKGKVKSPEHLEKIRRAALGKKLTAEHCKNISLGLAKNYQKRLDEQMKLIKILN